jgi:type II secretory pathway pseudopilin PulG
MGKIKKRAGFTLIEVIVALGILMIVVLALVSSYYSYYNSVKQMTYRAIGQNLAEVMLEDARSLQVAILDSLVKGGQYPSTVMWKMYAYHSPDPVVYEESVSFADGIPDSIPYPPDTNHDETPEGVGYIYDSGKIDSSFRLEGVNAVFGKNDGTIDKNSDSYKNLPSSIIITPVYHFDGTNVSYDYTILLNKETFPNYQREIKITDLTPGIAQTASKLYKIDVTIYWNVGGKVDPTTGEIVGGTEQSITVTGEKSFTP